MKTIDRMSALVALVIAVSALTSATAAAQEHPAPGSQVRILDASGPEPDWVPSDDARDTDTHLEPRWAIFGAGVTVFGVSYLSMLVGALTASSATPSQSGLELAAIPIVGPFLVLDRRETAFAVGLVLDGVGQIAGAIMAIVGLADGQRVASPHAGDVSFRFLGPGASLTLTF